MEKTREDIDCKILTMTQKKKIFKLIFKIQYWIKPKIKKKTKIKFDKSISLVLEFLELSKIF